jgi:hypothetical protein
MSTVTLYFIADCYGVHDLSIVSETQHFTFLSQVASFYVHRFCFDFKVPTDCEPEPRPHVAACQRVWILNPLLSNLLYCLRGFKSFRVSNFICGLWFKILVAVSNDKKDEVSQIVSSFAPIP